MEVLDPAGTNRQLSKSITRALQHSILQLCNEHVGYNHKLQILGVLCMTVDDEQQELVVKVNNTLKRVGAVQTSLDGRQKNPSQSNTATWPETSFEFSNTNYGAQNGDINEKLPDSSSPVQTPPSGHNRRSGRKASNPVKWERAFDDNSTNALEEDEPVDGQETSTPKTNVLPQQKFDGGSDVKASGSAKRKPLVQHRIQNQVDIEQELNPSDDSNSSSGLVVNSVRSLASAMGVDLNTSLAEGGKGTSAYSDNTSAPMSLGQPVYTAGTLSQNDSGLAMDGNATLDSSSGGSPFVVATQMNGHDALSPGQVSTHSPSPAGGRLYIEVGNEHIEVKREGGENNQFPRPLNLAPEPFINSGLGRASGDSTGSSELRSRLENSTNTSLQTDNGLSIQYTNTGPYTVNSHGQDVSGLSTPPKRTPDPDFYDETLDYMVDSFATGSVRKKRRRVGEEELTPEEVAEYLGSSDIDGQPENFRCKFCNLETKDVQKYVQHTILAHHTYLCHQCGKCFTTKSSLLRHRPIHTGMRRFACSICKKTFYRKDKCKAHIKRHLGPDQNPEQYATTASLSVALGECRPPVKSQMEQYIIDAADGE